MKDFKFKVGDIFTGREGISLDKTYRAPHRFRVVGFTDRKGSPYACVSLEPRLFHPDWSDDEMVLISRPGNDGF